MSRWAVIGASSFSGKSFCRHLRARGEEVEELSRPFYDLNKDLGVFVDALSSQRPRYVVNFAALNMVAESWAHFADYYQTNVVATSRLADALRRMTIEKYVHISTPEVYGSTSFSMNERAPINPSTPYAVSKAAIDMHLLVLFKAYGFPVVFTRSANVYGQEQQPYRIIPKTVLKILRGERLALHGGGTSTRSFVHIDDISESIYLVATKGRAGEVYHASTDRQISIRDLVSKICALLDVRPEDAITEAEERPGKDAAYQLDSEKIRNELGWVDRVELDAGLRDTVNWFRASAEHYAGVALEYQHRG